jgi:hypothetical protein
MPLFDIICEEHGKQEVLSSSSDSLDCPLCKRTPRRLWTKDVMKIVIDFTPGWDMGAGRNFSTRSERDNWVAMKGIRKLWERPRGTVVSRIV